VGTTVEDRDVGTIEGLSHTSRCEEPLTRSAADAGASRARCTVQFVPMKIRRPKIRNQRIGTSGLTYWW
jgi:hypothetical protein